MRRILKTFSVTNSANEMPADYEEQPPLVQLLTPSDRSNGVMNNECVLYIEDSNGGRWFVSAREIEAALTTGIKQEF